MGKPNALIITPRVLGRAKALASQTGSVTDRAIVAMIHYQSIVEDIRIKYHGLERLANHDVREYADYMLTKLDDWRFSSYTQCQSPDMVRTHFQAARMYIFEMGMLYHFHRARSPHHNSSNTNSIIIDMLTLCVHSIKEYLDSFFNIEDTRITEVPFEEWHRLIFALFVLYKLSVGIREFPSWRPDTCRNIINLEACLNMIVKKLDSHIPKDHKTVDASLTMFGALPEILRTAKASYVLAKAVDGNLHQIPSDFRAHASPHVRLGDGACTSALLQVDQDQAVPPATSETSRRARCPATSMWAAQALRTNIRGHWRGLDICVTETPDRQREASARMWADLLYQQAEHSKMQP
jgi:hypothetical protein